VATCWLKPSELAAFSESLKPRHRRATAEAALRRVPPNDRRRCPESSRRSRSTWSNVRGRSSSNSDSADRWWCGDCDSSSDCLLRSWALRLLAAMPVTVRLSSPLLESASTSRPRWPSWPPVSVVILFICDRGTFTEEWWLSEITLLDSSECFKSLAAEIDLPATFWCILYSTTWCQDAALSASKKLLPSFPFFASAALLSVDKHDHYDSSTHTLPFGVINDKLMDLITDVCSSPVGIIFLLSQAEDWTIL